MFILLFIITLSLLTFTMKKQWEARGDAVEYIPISQWQLPHTGKYSTVGKQKNKLIIGKLHSYVFIRRYERILNQPPLR